MLCRGHRRAGHQASQCRPHQQRADHEIEGQARCTTPDVEVSARYEHREAEQRATEQCQRRHESHKPNEDPHRDSLPEMPRAVRQVRADPLRQLCARRSTGNGEICLEYEPSG